MGFLGLVVSNHGFAATSPSNSSSTQAARIRGLAGQRGSLERIMNSPPLRHSNGPNPTHPQIDGIFLSSWQQPTQPVSMLNLVSSSLAEVEVLSGLTAPLVVGLSQAFLEKAIVFLLDGSNDSFCSKIIKTEPSPIGKSSILLLWCTL